MQYKSHVGGILSIVSGILGILWAAGMIALIFLFRSIVSMPMAGAPPNTGEIFNMVTIVYGIMGVVLAILGVLGIVGGVYAMNRRLWGLALAGAISGILTFLPTGIAATIYIAQAQKEFSVPKPVGTETAGAPPQP